MDVVFTLRETAMVTTQRAMPRLAAICALLISANTVQADDILGIYAGAGQWQQEYSGDFESLGNEVDIEEDLALDDDSNMVMYVAVEHPLPILPNLRAQYTNVDTQADNVLSRTIQFNGVTYAASDVVASDISFTQSDAVMYYQLMDNWISLDVGMALSWVDGSIEVASSTAGAAADFDEVVPMLYGKIRADLPLTGLWVGAEAQGLEYDNNSMLEFNAQVGWESSKGLGLEAGYRAMEMQLDSFDEVDAAHLDIKGPYAALNYHF